MTIPVAVFTASPTVAMAFCAFSVLPRPIAPLNNALPPAEYTPPLYNAPIVNPKFLINLSPIKLALNT